MNTKWEKGLDLVKKYKISVGQWAVFWSREVTQISYL